MRTLLTGLAVILALVVLAGANDAQLVGYTTYDYPAISPDGRMIAFTSTIDGDAEVYILDLESGETRKLTDNEEMDASPVWTPDGRALIHQRELNGNREIFALALDSMTSVNLTRNPGEDSHPKVSADGEWIIFDSNRDDEGAQGNDDVGANYEIYRMRIDGSDVERLTVHDGWDTYPDFSPDGRSFVWRRVVGPERNSEIFRKDLETGEERNLTNHPAFDGYPDFTPDRRILFASNRPGERGDFDIFLLDPDSGDLQRLTFAVDDPAFHRITRPRASPDGTWAVANRYTDRHLNHLYRFEIPGRDAPTELRFTRMRTSEIDRDGGLSRGVAWGDANGDGWVDLVIGNTIDQNDFLYWNREGVSFEQEHDSPVVRSGGWTEGVHLVDVDNDGDLDLLAARTDDLSMLYLNDGSGAFAPAPASDITRSESSDSQFCWADVDNDGDLDAVAATRDEDDPILYLGRGDGRFDRAVPNPFAGHRGNARTCAFGDADLDGDLDLAIGNFVIEEEDGYRKQEGFFYRADGRGGFTLDQIPGFTDTGALSYGLSWADPDGDGDLDLTQTRISKSDEHPGFYRNEDGRFREAYAELFAEIRHGPSKGHVWADFDNDGDLDLFVANGTEGFEPTEEFRLTNVLFENRDGVMHPVEAGGLTEEATVSAGTAAADFDNDGDLDLVVANWGGSDEENALYRNDGARGNWLQVRLEGVRSNRMGIGAIARLEATIDGEERIQLRQMLLNTGYASASDPRLHFGLGDAPSIERLEITWPSGIVDLVIEPSINSVITIREGGHPR